VRARQRILVLSPAVESRNDIRTALEALVARAEKEGSHIDRLVNTRLRGRLIADDE